VVTLVTSSITGKAYSRRQMATSMTDNLRKVREAAKESRTTQTIADISVSGGKTSTMGKVRRSKVRKSGTKDSGKLV